MEQNPEKDLHKYTQGVFDKSAKGIQWEKDRLFKKWHQSNSISIDQKMNLTKSQALYKN